METIGFMDRVENKTIRLFYKNDSESLFRQKKADRIIEAMRELKHTGNIAVYLIKGNKQRFLFCK